MQVRTEIELFAQDADKDILIWLFNRYSYESKWHFVARCTFERYGKLSFEIRRIWAPTEEGRLLFNHRDELGSNRSKESS